LNPKVILRNKYITGIDKIIEKIIAHNMIPI